MILLVGLAHAADIVVGVDATTITEAIALAESGDHVEIPPGTWSECIDTAGKSLTFSGGGTIDGTGLCDNTVRVASGETVTFEDLTVVNANGRAFDLEWSGVTLSNVTVTGTGRSDWSGGGLWVYGATLRTTGMQFEGNVAYEGADVYLYAYADWQDSGSNYTGGTAVSSGGAIMAYYDNTVTLANDQLSANTAGYYGGALATWDYTDLVVTNSTFEENSAPTSGGGAIFYYPTDTAYGVLELDSSVFRANTASDGGALWLGWVDSVTVRDNAFNDNVATATGGAILEYVGNTASFMRNTFCSNTAVAGGAMSVQWTNADTLSTNTFVANTAADGGALHRYAAYGGSIVQNTFAGNSASDWGGAYYASYGYADLRNNLVVDSSGAGIYAADAYSYGSSTVAYNGFAGNAVADAAGYFYAGDNGNVLAAEPGFVAWDPAAGCDGADLRLRGASPFKDAGDPSVLDLDGSRSDIGAWGGVDQDATDADGDGYDTTEDCDDTSVGAHPGATETCNGVDDDCANGVDDAAASDAPTWYADADGDGYGDPAVPTPACAQADGWVADASDCDDGDRWVNPAASDVPGDGLDADCDGQDGVQVLPDGEGEPPVESDTGCGCSSSRGSGATWIGLVAAAWLVRRRRAGHGAPYLALPVALMFRTVAEAFGLDYNAAGAMVLTFGCDALSREEMVPPKTALS